MPVYKGLRDITFRKKKFNENLWMNEIFSFFFFFFKFKKNKILSLTSFSVFFSFQSHKSAPGWMDR
jgi:hypothetical protein